MFKTKHGESRGITLIALVVTIVVLLILAGISISALTGDNGIVNQANLAKIETELQSVEEAYNVYLVNSEKTNRDGTDFTKVDFLTKVYIGEEGEYVYAVNDLDKLNLNMDSGKGTIKTEISKYEDLNDVYFVDEEGNAAYIKDGVLYGDVNYMEELVETAEDFFTFDETTGTVTGIVENTSKDPNGVGYYYENKNGVSSKTKIMIPDTINGVTVKRIGDNAFEDVTNLEVIVIPDTVEYIGNYAFSDDKNLKEITIPDSVTAMGINTFESCTSLTDVTLSKSLTVISEATFRKCTSLKNIVIPNGVTRIDWRAFEGCSSLTSIRIPNSVKTISENGRKKNFFWL